MPPEVLSPVKRTSAQVSTAQIPQQPLYPPYALPSLTADNLHHERSHDFYQAIEVITAPISFSFTLSRPLFTPTSRVSGALGPLSGRYAPHLDPRIRQLPNSGYHLIVAPHRLPGPHPTYYHTPAARDERKLCVVGWTSSETPHRPTLLPRQRSAKACNRCRRRKTKCSGNNPCLRCVARGLPCAYEEAAAVRRPPAARRSATATAEAPDPHSDPRRGDGDGNAHTDCPPPPVAADSARIIFGPQRGLEAVWPSCPSDPGCMQSVSVAIPPAHMARARVDLSKGTDYAKLPTEIWGVTPFSACQPPSFGRAADAGHRSLIEPVNHDRSPTGTLSNGLETANTCDLSYAGGSACVAAACPAPASHQGVELRVPNTFTVFASSSLKDALKEMPLGRPC